MPRMKKIEAATNNKIDYVPSTPALPKKAVKVSKAAMTINTVEARSATRGGNIPFARYSRQPQDVATRLVEKTSDIVVQAENAYGRAIKMGDKALAKKFSGFIAATKKATSSLVA